MNTEKRQVLTRFNLQERNILVSDWNISVLTIQWIVLINNGEYTYKS